MSKKLTPKQIAVGRQLGKSFGLGAMYGGGPINMGGQNQLQRPHILMGTAAADMSNPMLNMLPHEQVRVQLLRHRLSIPFPCNVDEVYFACVPDFIREWVEQGYFDSPPRNPVIANAVVLMSQQVNRIRPFGSTQSEAVQLVVRYRVNDLSRPPSLESEITFWIRTSRTVPHPAVVLSHGVLQYPEDGPHRNIIVAWGAEAEELNSKIDAYTQFVKGYNDILSTAADVKVVWPELLSFVSFRNEHVPPVDRKRERKLVNESRRKDQGLKVDIIDMLTSAAMLKENYKLPAWTGFAVE